MAAATAVATEGITWNCTTWLNIAFLALAAALVVQFVRTGGMPMLAAMGGSPDPDGPDGDGSDAHAHYPHCPPKPGPPPPVPLPLGYSEV